MRWIGASTGNSYFGFKLFLPKNSCNIKVSKIFYRDIEKEDVIIELLKEISTRLSTVEEQQKQDRIEFNSRFEKIENKEEMIRKKLLIV